MREHAEETLTPREFRFGIEAEHLNLKQNLPADIRQNLYLIYKEAVTNAAKHSNGDTLLVTMKKSGTGFEMRICDNGTTAEKACKCGTKSQEICFTFFQLSVHLNLFRNENN